MPEVSTQQKARDVAARAADLIEREGWVQGEYHVPDGGYCLIGAIRTVVQDVTRGGLDGWALEQEVIERAFRGRTAWVSAALRWNDARGRTKEEVVQVLRRAAE